MTHSIFYQIRNGVFLIMKQLINPQLYLIFGNILIVKHILQFSEMEDKLNFI